MRSLKLRWRSVPGARLCGQFSSSSSAVRDLSSVHTAIGALFGRLPPTHGRVPDSWALLFDKYKLSDEQLDFYCEKGYITGIKGLPPDDVDRLLQEYNSFLQWDEMAHANAMIVDRSAARPASSSQPSQQPHRESPEKHHIAGEDRDVWKPKHPGMHLFYEFHSNETGDPSQVLMHALGHWRVSALFHDLVFLPNIIIPTAQLLGLQAHGIKRPAPPAGVRFWHDQLFAKPPHCGANVAWHQDYSYWTRTVPMNHLVRILNWTRSCLPWQSAGGQKPSAITVLGCRQKGCSAASLRSPPASVPRLFLPPSLAQPLLHRLALCLPSVFCDLIWLFGFV